MPKRIQLQRTKGWRMPAGAVKVDRATKWGNPFRVVCLPKHRWTKARFAVEFDGERVGEGQLTEREAAGVATMRFAAEVAPQIDLAPLRGRDLACWCKPGEPCHADVLLELANA